MPPVTDALILTAGLGSRLDPLTRVRAKPAVPVAGVPLVRRIVRELVKHGVTNITMNLHARPDTLTRVVGDGADLGARVRYSWEQPEILGSAGGPRLALDIVQADTFLLANGDTLSDMDLTTLLEAHRSSGALVTMALVPNTRYRHYGGVRLDADGAVTGFVPRGEGAAGSFHFFGRQVVCRRAFDNLPPGKPAQSVGGVYDRLISERPGSVRGFISDAHYWDIGTLLDYWTTSLALATRWAPHQSIVWDDVEIGRGAVLDECIVTDGVRVPAGAVYRRVVLTRTSDNPLLVTPFDAGTS